MWSWFIIFWFIVGFISSVIGFIIDIKRKKNIFGFWKIFYSFLLGSFCGYITVLFVIIVIKEKISYIGFCNNNFYS